MHLLFVFLSTISSTPFLKNSYWPQQCTFSEKAWENAAQGQGKENSTSITFRLLSNSLVLIPTTTPGITFVLTTQIFRTFLPRSWIFSTVSSSFCLTLPFSGIATSIIWELPSPLSMILSIILLLLSMFAIFHSYDDLWEHIIREQAVCPNLRPQVSSRNYNSSK